MTLGVIANKEKEPDDDQRILVHDPLIRQRGIAGRPVRDQGWRGGRG